MSLEAVDLGESGTVVVSMRSSSSSSSRSEPKSKSLKPGGRGCPGPGGNDPVPPPEYLQMKKEQ